MAAAIFVALCGARAVPGHAAEGEKAAAKAHYETATRLYDVREYAKALEVYKAAYLAKPDPAFLFNRCSRKPTQASRSISAMRGSR